MEKIFGKNIVTSIQAADLMKQYGSPIYLYDAEIVRKKAKLLTEAAKGFHISYAMKANSNSQILRLLQ